VLDLLKRKSERISYAYLAVILIFFEISNVLLLHLIPSLQPFAILQIFLLIIVDTFSLANLFIDKRD